ncbi:MAG: hypothetical protein L3J79_06240 [Candidatus Marinimicrobia bacterium]|nr:hypothetical protein [Candidatus Neomarinimicrobiota bacterium]
MHSRIKQSPRRDKINSGSRNDHGHSAYSRSTGYHIPRILIIFFSIVSILLLVMCDQTPTTFDEEPFLDDPVDGSFGVEITAFEFDFPTQEFFFSVAVISPPEGFNIQAQLLTSQTESSIIALNDLGLEGDIQTQDGSYDGNWTLPDSIAALMDSLWTLMVTTDPGPEAAIQNIQPERPAPPVIREISHQDTLTLLTDALVLDTLRVTVTHPKGLDEIRSVSLMSLKPDGSYANLGNPITLYDDGGAELSAYWETWDIMLTSGDEVAGDGIYSLVLPLEPAAQNGTYYWTFNSQSWLGVEAEAMEDSLLVLPAPGLLKSDQGLRSQTGVFQ